MFIIKCLNCGREQKWGAGIVPGECTEIEIADKAVYCTCGNFVEEENGKIFEYENN
jgi:hypothetical protein